MIKFGKNQNISFPRYSGFVKSFYRNPSHCSIPVVQDSNFMGVFPRMICWQFPDLDLLDWLYNHIEEKAINGELSEGHCLSNGKGGVHTDVKDSFDVPVYIAQLKLDMHTTSDFELSTLCLDNWIKHCSMEYMMHNPMYLKKNLCIEKSLMQYQFYLPGGGFKTLHHERQYSHEDFLTQQRELVFMIYLNDIVDKENKGGTHFVNHDLTLPCRKGLTCIFPAGPDFSHVGSIHEKEKKAIMTGWIITNPRDQ